jgi:hypothetical protein
MSRDELRKNISPRYSGIAHFAFTVTMSLGTTVGLAAFVRGLRPVELWAIAASFVLFCLIEYTEHRWLLHKRRAFAPFAFRIHTLEHHVFFTDDNFLPEGRRDYHFVLFPPGLVLGYHLGAVPVFTAIGWLAFSRNVGLLVGSTTAFFFFAYEMVHFASHIGSKIPGVRWLAEHHRIHHKTELMTSCNFNVVFPIFDWVFRTRVSK